MTNHKALALSFLSGIFCLALYLVVSFFLFGVKGQMAVAFIIMSCIHFFAALYFVSTARPVWLGSFLLLAPCTFIFLGTYIYGYFAPGPGPIIELITLPLAAVIFFGLGLAMARTKKRVSIPVGLAAIALYSFLIGFRIMDFITEAKPNYSRAPKYENTHSLIDSVELLNTSYQPTDNAMLKNKIVVLDFWASYCKPCFEAMPHFQQLHNKYQSDTNYLFISVNLPVEGDAETYLEDKVKALPYTFPIMAATDSLPKLLNVSTIPQYAVFSKQGQLIYNGTIPVQGFHKKMDTVLAMAKRNKVMRVL